MPTGNLHIGNYLGAIKQWVEFQKSCHVFVMIADLHAITTLQNPKELSAKTLEVAGLLIACGLDPKKSTLFIQSRVPAHTELAWILNTITPIGELERMTQFKEKQDKAGALAGLLNYPVLQAADMLLYKPDVVPVGEDQVQHLEFTRTLAQKFNNRFGNVFKIPQALIKKGSSRIMGLDDPYKKMSKSAQSPNNYIAFLDSSEEIKHKIKIAVTDSGKEIRYDPAEKPAISNLIMIYSSFSGMAHSKIEKKYKEKGYAEFKDDLAELLVNKLTPIQERYRKFIQDKKMLLSMLRKGIINANKIAQKTLSETQKKIGFIRL